MFLNYQPTHIYIYTIIFAVIYFSDHEFIEEQEVYLYSICTRTMALPVGRSVLSYTIVHLCIYILNDKFILWYSVSFYISLFMIDGYHISFQRYVNFEHSPSCCYGSFTNT